MSGHPTPGLRVLIAEDSPDCAESTALYLRLFGHTVEIARDGPEALGMAGTFRPDAVLLDVAIPKVNGIEVAKRLSANRPALTPLIVTISGYGPNQVKALGGDAGIDLHMVKPVDPEQLQGVLDRFKKVMDGLAS